MNNRIVTDSVVVGGVNDDDEPTTPGEEDFLAKARERAMKAQNFWKPKYDLCAEDKRFYAGNSENNYQWPETALTLRGERPKLTVNRLPQFHNQIVNDYRQASIGMRAAPQGDEDKIVAETYAGLFKQIEKQSYAQVAYVTALSNAAIGGLGWLRVVSDYARPDSFDQDLFIRRIVNPSRVLPDPLSTDFFCEDGRYLFYLDKVSYTDYEDEHGEDPCDFVPDDEFHTMWRDDAEKTVTIGEYFYFKPKKKKLFLLKDGTSIFDEDFNQKAVHPQTGEAASDFIVKSRMADVKELHWCKMDGYRVLEERLWPKPRIPFIPIWGNELWVDDERTFEGQVRGVKDSQRMYNYMQSTKTEMIALSPKAPYIAAEGQLEGRETEWRDAATTPKSVLYYKPTTVDGLMVQPPMRQTYEAPVAAIIQASLQASDDMKAVLGVYDASLGARGNEVSGRAINARKMEGDTATYNYVDNLSMGIGYMGTVIAELIPVYYDAKRTVRIITPENKTKIQSINGQGDPDLVSVQYDLVLDTGPSYTTQRQEAVAIISELAHNFPQLMEAGGDIAIRNMNFKGSDEIADRLKRMLPPVVVGDDADPETKLAVATRQLEDAKKLIEALTAQVKEDEVKITEQGLALKDKSGELRIKQQEVSIKRMEVQAKIREADNGEGGGSSDNSDLVVSIAELTAMVAELQDMVESLAGGEEYTPAAPEAPAPSAPEMPVSDQPTEGE